MTNDSRTPNKLKMMIFAIMISFVVVSYQNCGTANKDGSYKMQNINESTKVTFVFGMNSINLISLLKPTNDGYGPYVYNVNVSAGTAQKRYYEINQNDPANIDLGDYCLTDDWKNQLRSALDAASVCLYTTTVPPGTECTEQYVYPHTLVQQDSTNYKLGESVGGCPEIKYDICQDQLNAYANVMNEFLAQVESLSCN